MALAIDPATGGGDGCVRTAAGQAPGTAVYRLPAAPAGGYTLMGAATVIARLRVRGEPSDTQVASRLWDVAPDGTQRLVARALLRPSGRATDVWQLHPNGWTFAEGHVPKLELLGADAPYARPSNQPFEIVVEGLELRLPVRERPDCRVVLPAATPVRPPRQPLAPGISPRAGAGCGSRLRRRPRLRLRLRCVATGVRAIASVRGAAVRRVDFYAARRRVARDRRRPFARTLDTRGRRVRIMARATLADGRRLRTTRRGRRCSRGRGPHFTG